MRDLQGLSIIMVGGSGGIGSATANRIAGPGVNIGICSIDTPRLKELGEELRAKGTNVYTKHVDTSNPHDIRAFIDECCDLFKGADILINFAGLSIDATLETLTEEQWDTVINANLKGNFFATQAFADRVNGEKGALVVNFASMAAKRPGGGNVHYAAAKSAVYTLSQALAQQMKRKNIKFTSMLPGPTSTTFFAGRKTEAEMSGFMKADDVAEILEFIMKRSDRLVFHEVSVDSYAFFNR
jgi:3-oxoacyl-[acyl-carrier protein] reductase